MTTSDRDLAAAFKNEPLFGGVVCKDELRRLSPNGKAWIINMEDSDEGDGSHWVLCSDIDPLPVVYIDSYGVAPPPEIIAFMNRSRRGKPGVFSKFQYQSLESQNCGRYCVDFIRELLEHRRDPRWEQKIDDDLTPYPSAFNERETGKVRLSRRSK